jgi:hypothetical protein
MVDQILLYISAAADLEHERELLVLSIVDIPVTLGWEIKLSPVRGEPADVDSVARADIHLLLLGGDIRAPIGLEWLAARRSGHLPVLFSKKSILRTPAAQDFVRHIAKFSSWRSFKDAQDMRVEVLSWIADHLIEKAIHYALTPEESDRLEKWRDQLHTTEPEPLEGRRVTGESSVILSPERYVPKEGVLIEPKPGRNTESEA